MPKEEPVRIQGRVEETLKGDKFLVRTDNLDHVIIAHLSGRIRINRLKIIPGDTVAVELSPYDLTKGRIVYRK